MIVKMFLLAALTAVSIIFAGAYSLSLRGFKKAKDCSNLKVVVAFPREKWPFGYLTFIVSWTIVLIPFAALADYLYLKAVTKNWVVTVVERKGILKRVVKRREFATKEEAYKWSEELERELFGCN